MLASAFRGYIGDRAFQNFQQSLLYAFSGNIPGDGDVFALLCDLVDLIHIDNTDLSAGDVSVRGLKQTEDNVFHIFSDISRLGQRGGIGNTERHVKHFRHRAGEQGLSAAGGTDQKNIALFNIHTVVCNGRGMRLESFVVIVHSDGKDFFRIVLSDDEFIKFRLDFRRFGHFEFRDGIFGALRFCFLLL